jgi:hypothetical protein
MKTAWQRIENRQRRDFKTVLSANASRDCNEVFLLAEGCPLDNPARAWRVLRRAKGIARG